MMNHIIVAMKQRSGRFGGSNRNLNDSDEVEQQQEVTAGADSSDRWISQTTPAFPRPMNGLSPKLPTRQESIPRKVADHQYQGSLSQQDIDDMLSTTEVEETEYGSSGLWTDADNNNDLQVWKLEYPEDDRITNNNVNQEEQDQKEDIDEVLVQPMEVITTSTTTDSAPARRRLPRRKKRLFDRTPYPMKMTFRFRGGGARNNNSTDNNNNTSDTATSAANSNTAPRLPNRRSSVSRPKPGMMILNDQELLLEEEIEEDVVSQSSSPHTAPSPKRRGRRQNPPRLPRRKLSRDH